MIFSLQCEKIGFQHLSKPHRNKTIQGLLARCRALRLIQFPQQVQKALQVSPPSFYKAAPNFLQNVDPAYQFPSLIREESNRAN